MVSAADLPELLTSHASSLERERVPDEALAMVATRRRVLGIGGGDVLKPAGRVWRVGVVLLHRDGRLFATGTVTRAAEPRQHGYTSVSAAERGAIRALAAAAFAPGEVVNYDVDPIATDPDALATSDGVLRAETGGPVLVRWSHGGSYIDFERYLAERTDLLIEAARRGGEEPGTGSHRP